MVAKSITRPAHLQKLREARSILSNLKNPGVGKYHPTLDPLETPCIDDPLIVTIGRTIAVDEPP